MTNTIRARTHGRGISESRCHDHRLPCDGMKQIAMHQI
jgi:hypothetical protein